MDSSEPNHHSKHTPVPPSQRRSASQNSLVTKKAHSPTLRHARKDCSNKRKEEHFCSTKSANSNFRFRRNCCGSWKKEHFVVSVALKILRSMYAYLPRPIAI